MPYDPSNPLYNITVPAPKTTIHRASAQLIADRPKATTEQALHCYDYIKANSMNRPHFSSAVALKALIKRIKRTTDGVLHTYESYDALTAMHYSKIVSIEPATIQHGAARISLIK